MPGAEAPLSETGKYKPAEAKGGGGVTSVCFFLLLLFFYTVTWNVKSPPSAALSRVLSSVDEAPREAFTLKSGGKGKKMLKGVQMSHFIFFPLSWLLCGGTWQHEIRFERLTKLAVRKPFPLFVF